MVSGLITWLSEPASVIYDAIEEAKAQGTARLPGTADNVEVLGPAIAFSQCATLAAINNEAEINQFKAKAIREAFAKAPVGTTVGGSFRRNGDFLITFDHIGPAGLIAKAQAIQEWTHISFQHNNNNITIPIIRVMTPKAPPNAMLVQLRNIPDVLTSKDTGKILISQCYKYGQMINTEKDVSDTFYARYPGLDGINNTSMICFYVRAPTLDPHLHALPTSFKYNSQDITVWRHGMERPTRAASQTQPPSSHPSNTLNSMGYRGQPTAPELRFQHNMSNAPPSTAAAFQAASAAVQAALNNPQNRAPGQRGGLGTPVRSQPQHDRDTASPDFNVHNNSLFSQSPAQINTDLVNQGPSQLQTSTNTPHTNDTQPPLQPSNKPPSTGQAMYSSSSAKPPTTQKGSKHNRRSTRESQQPNCQPSNKQLEKKSKTSDPLYSKIGKGLNAWLIESYDTIPEEQRQQLIKKAAESFHNWDQLEAVDHTEFQISELPADLTRHVERIINNLQLAEITAYDTDNDMSISPSTTTVPSPSQPMEIDAPKQRSSTPRSKPTQPPQQIPNQHKRAKNQVPWYSRTSTPSLTPQKQPAATASKSDSSKHQQQPAAQPPTDRNQGGRGRR
jgi:hypothetical protein